MRNKSALCIAALAAFAACADPTRGEAEPFCPESHFLHEIIDGGAAVMIRRESRRVGSAVYSGVASYGDWEFRIHGRKLG